MAKIADFLLFLRVEKGLSVSAVRGYRSTLTAMFKYKLPDLSSDFILRDLVRSFALARPPTKLADFLCFLCLEKLLSISAIKGYRSALSVVFKFRLPELVDNFVLRDLIQSFELQHPQCPVRPPSWDLVRVLMYLRGPIFEPLPSK